MLDIHIIFIYNIYIIIEETEAQVTFLKLQVLTGKRS